MPAIRELSLLASTAPAHPTDQPRPGWHPGLLRGKPRRVPDLQIPERRQNCLRVQGRACGAEQASTAAPVISGSCWGGRGGPTVLRRIARQLGSEVNQAAGVSAREPRWFHWAPGGLLTPSGLALWPGPMPFGIPLEVVAIDLAVRPLVTPLRPRAPPGRGPHREIDLSNRKDQR